VKIGMVVGALAGGGAERQFTMLAAALAERGVDVSLAYFEGSVPVAVKRRLHRVRLVKLKSGEPRMTPPALRIAWICRDLLSFIRTERPDVIYSALTPSNLLSALCVALGSRTPLVWGMRSTCEPLDGRVPLIRVAVSFASGVADAAIANGVAVREWNQARGVRPRRWFVIANGLDFERYATRYWCERERGMVIGALARVTPEKDHATLIEAFSKLATTAPGARLLIAGRVSQADRERLSAIAYECAVQEQVEFLGEVEDVASFLRGLDVHVSSSIYEGFPNAILEAMAVGVPTVSTRVGAVPELVADAGLLVEPANPQLLAEALSKVCASPALRAKLSEAGRTRALAKFGLDAMVNSTLVALREVVSSRRGCEHAEADEGESSFEKSNRTKPSGLAGVR
jgi:glycosyltransferase involved in cell wall biosynthesis